jgi:hypothetical protein
MILFFFSDCIKQYPYSKNRKNNCTKKRKFFLQNHHRYLNLIALNRNIFRAIPKTERTIVCSLISCVKSTMPAAIFFAQFQKQKERLYVI